MSRLDDIADWADKLPDEWLHCRRYGHSWTASHVDEIDNAFDETAICNTCDTRRVQAIHRFTGEILANRYIYPEGYGASGFGYLSGRDRGEIRLARTRRYIPQQRKAAA